MTEMNNLGRKKNNIPKPIIIVSILMATLFILYGYFFSYTITDIDRKIISYYCSSNISEDFSEYKRIISEQLNLTSSDKYLSGKDLSLLFQENLIHPFSVKFVKESGLEEYRLHYQQKLSDDLHKAIPIIRNISNEVLYTCPEKVTDNGSLTMIITLIVNYLSSPVEMNI